MIASCSSYRSNRSPSDGNGMPYAVCSASNQPGADAELDPAAAHLVDLGDRDGQRSGQPEGGRGHQRAQPDPAGLPGQPGQRQPRVGRSGQPVAAHRQVVVGPEEGVEAGLLGTPGDGEQVVVGGAQLGFGEDPQFHASTLASYGRDRRSWPLGVCSPAGPGRMIARRSTRRCSSCSASRRVVRSSAPSSRRASPTSGWRPPRPAGSRPNSSAPGSRLPVRRPAPSWTPPRRRSPPRSPPRWRPPHRRPRRRGRRSRPGWKPPATPSPPGSRPPATPSRPGSRPPGRRQVPAWRPRRQPPPRPPRTSPPAWRRRRRR